MLSRVFRGAPALARASHLVCTRALPTRNASLHRRFAHAALFRGDTGSLFRRANSDSTSSEFVKQWFGGGGGGSGGGGGGSGGGGGGPFAWLRRALAWLDDFFRYRVPDALQAPLVVHALFWPNIAVFGAWKWVEAGRDRGAVRDMYRRFSVYPGSQPYTLLTAAFSHQQFMHLLFNMFVFHSFAPVVCAQFASGASFAAYYCAAAVVSNAVQRFMAPSAVSLGASGATNALMATYATLFPTSTLSFFFVPVPAAFAVAALMAYDLYNSQNSNSSIGHNAHLAGAAFGVVTALLLRRL